jgi:hypothetical protein
MKIKSKSHFKEEKSDTHYFKNWVKKVEANNDRKYEHYEVSTSIRKT